MLKDLNDTYLKSVESYHFVASTLDPGYRKLAFITDTPGMCTMHSIPGFTLFLWLLDNNNKNRNASAAVGRRHYQLDPLPQRCGWKACCSSGSLKHLCELVFIFLLLCLFIRESDFERSIRMSARNGNMCGSRNDRKRVQPLSVDAGYTE